MKILIAALAFVAAASAAPPAYAEDETETIVVTGSRASLSRREIEALPYVVLIRRADHLINRISVTDDTRDPKLRAQEMRSTLKALVKEASRNPRVTLSIGDKTLKDFDETMIDSIVGTQSYGGISRARIVAKTAISGGDTFESASARIEDFVKRVPNIGRSETKTDASWDLTIVRPQQYHGAVVAKIAAEAKESAAKFGLDYGAIVDGIHEPVLWYRAGDLNLALFIRYSMVIAQKGTGKIVIQRKQND